MRSVLAALCLFATTAHAVPAQFSHQGRLLDADGTPLEGETTLTFRVTDSETGGSALWEETLTLTLTNGFYAAVLGADDDTNPLDADVLSQAPLWLELQLEGEGAMFPRSPIHSVPYATMAGSAEEVTGGPVDASAISVGGTPVVSESGEWVGPAPTVNWADIEGMPDAFADGIDDDTDTDTDTLAALGTSCIDGDVPVWDEAMTTWVCGMDADTLAAMDCLDGQLVLWSDDTTGWVCSDTDFALSTELFTGSYLDLTDVPEDWLDGDDDTQLTEAQVDAMVSDNGYAMATAVFSGSFLDLTDLPDGLTDGDTTLTEAEVDEMVSDNGYSLASDTEALMAEIETLREQLAEVEAAVEEAGDSSVGTVMYGDYSISNSVDLAGMEGFTEITGSLHISAGDVPNLDALSTLTRVGGSLRIQDNDALTDLAGLANVTSVGGWLTVDANDNLSSLNGLSTITSVQHLQVSENPNLLSIDALSALTAIERTLQISGNPLLVSLGGLESVTSLNGDLYILNNDSLVDITALSSTSGSLTGLEVGDNEVLPNLDGLEGVVSVDGNLIIRENPLLTSISALMSITSFGGGTLAGYMNDNLCSSSIETLREHLMSYGWYGGDYSNWSNKSC